MDNLTQILLDINGCNDEHALRQINEMCCGKLRSIHQAKNIMAGLQFKVGDEVEFDGKRGVVERGTIIKINPKTIKVKVGFVTWSCSASLLRKV